MQILQDIGLLAVEILTLVFGMLGMSFSLLLLFSPAVVKNLGRVLNRSVDVNKRLLFLDREIRTENLFYSHPTVVGLCLMGGSLFALLFFFFKLDISKFAQIFFGSARSALPGQILFETLAWIGKIACALGFVFGLLLVVAPDRMRRIDKKLNSWFETRSLVEKLERQNRELDTLLYRYPLAFGIVGAVVSFLLIILSILNLMR
jgi:hypothetical protein